jgi:hypothetical protein
MYNRQRLMPLTQILPFILPFLITAIVLRNYRRITADLKANNNAFNIKTSTLSSSSSPQQQRRRHHYHHHKTPRHRLHP